MGDPELLYQVRDASAWITINREKRGNALSLEIIDLFSDYLDRAEADDEIKVICLTAVGEKTFCSGADLASTMGAEDHIAGARKYASLLKRMARFPKPFVARVNGRCLAGGMGLMLSCDLVYAHEGSRFGTPEVNVGLFPHDDRRFDLQKCSPQESSGNDLHSQNAFSRGGGTDGSYYPSGSERRSGWSGERSALEYSRERRLSP